MTIKSERRIFHKLATVEDAIELLMERSACACGHESVQLDDAVGMVLAESVTSGMDLPPFDRAEMDGYAVNSEDVEGASETRPSSLKAVGSINAGDLPKIALQKGECAEIATGAPMPRGADSVVMVEHTSRRGEVIDVFKATTPGENVASVGTDVQTGEMVLRAGTLLGSREIGILAAIGMRDVKILRRPLVGIISTGNEIVEAGGKLPYGKVYDVNTDALTAAIIQAGCKPLKLGLLKDDYTEIETRISEGVNKCDVLLISGGTSAGVGDLVYKAIDEACEPGIIIHGLKVKPGKPTIIAFDGNKPIIGLPGYPVSALMIFNQIVRPLLLKMTGMPQKPNRVATAKLASRVNSAKGKEWFLGVHVIRKGDGLVAHPIISGSGAIGNLARADGYIRIEEGREFLDRGEAVDVCFFADGDYSPDLVIMGSHCPGLDLLLQILFEREGIRAKTANIGSYAGLKAVAEGEADISGVHMLDEKDLTYNLNQVKDAGLPESCLVKGYRRLQGVMVPKGNPRGIRGLEDLLRGGVVFVNRNRGSGTRVLTDRLIFEAAKRRGIELKEVGTVVKGYRWEAKTHSAVAAAVAHGRADLGVGVESAARAYGLDFIPIKYEEYDFIVSPESANKKSVKIFLECLRSKEFAEMLERMPGYRSW
uniref:Molybdopterin biosynthesis protein n=1 Tax=Candidatus Methanomethylicus mesodigestus TaxID=1867258 RepID=A0A7C3J243_9CREN